MTADDGRRTAKKALVSLALIALTATGVLAYQQQQKIHEQERLREALVLTNRFAGMTEDELDSLASSLSSNHLISDAAAREAVFWMVCSGKLDKSNMLARRPEVEQLIAHGASPRDAVHGAILAGAKPDDDPFIYCPK